MADTKKTTQVFVHTTPSGTAAGTPILLEFDFRGDFKRCIGYVLHVASNANNQKASIELKLADGDIIQDFVHYEHIEASASCPVSDRYHPADFNCQSQKMRITTKPLVNLTADVVLQVAFRLEK